MMLKPTPGWAVGFFGKSIPVILNGQSAGAVLARKANDNISGFPVAYRVVHGFLRDPIKMVARFASWISKGFGQRKLQSM